MDNATTQCPLDNGQNCHFMQNAYLKTTQVYYYNNISPWHIFVLQQAAHQSLSKQNWRTASELGWRESHSRSQTLTGWGLRSKYYSKFLAQPFLKKVQKTILDFEGYQISATQKGRLEQIFLKLTSHLPPTTKLYIDGS